VSRGEIFSVPYTVEQAVDCRDALSKALYHSLFEWIVSKINLVIENQKSDCFIGLLDIFGFEDFENLTQSSAGSV